MYLTFKNTTDTFVSKSNTAEGKIKNCKID